MYRLAKLGFTQSYNYFPWRNTKRELIEYFTELSQPPVSDFFRANLWPNTPDILPEYLQYGGRPGFMIRLVLAATLGASYGIYGPPFELMESSADRSRVKRNTTTPRSIRFVIGIGRTRPACATSLHS